MPSMFGDLRPLPPDAILGLFEEFQADPRPEKVSLASGVYVDETGITPILETVRLAEARILAEETTKVYKPIAGDPAYTHVVKELIFGPGHTALRDGRVETLHTPGGTGALRVAADLIRRIRPDATVWLSAPTWPNHPQILAAVGLPSRTYPYVDDRAGGLEVEPMLEALGAATPGDVVLLHACCHNPTGIDPRPEQWTAIAERIEQLGLLPLVDFAYQGLGEGLRADAVALTALAGPDRELLVASSFSKNFALYDERVGALSLVGATAEDAATLLTHAKFVVRSNYSNPPAHGGEIVAMVLTHPELRGAWEGEVTAMRQRIDRNRRSFVAGLEAAGAEGDHRGLLRQRGMFSLLGLSAEQVARLRSEFAVYVVGAGRVNVAGLTRSNIDRVCDAIAAVLRD
jgi:aspartate/tyrosine/aromatic aminotransferase